MIQRIELTLPASAMDKLVELGGLHNIYVEACNSDKIYVKFERETAPRLLLKENMTIKSQLPINRLYISNFGDTEANLVLIGYDLIEINIWSSVV